ncbi:MAG: LysR family transcriptional regulator [Sulfuricellaceae bacterium]
MKIQHLRFLVAVMDYGGVTKAAERLHLSQPSISTGLKALEQELGGEIFDRSGPANRPLRLTPAGRRFYRAALDILRQCEAAHTDFLGESTTRRRVRLGILDTLPQDAIADVLRMLGDREPNLRIDLWEGSVERLAGWLAQERVDLAWTNVHDLAPNARVLWREPLVAVVAPAHPLAGMSAGIPIRELAKQAFVHRSRCELDAVGRAQLRAAGVKLEVRARVEREDLAFRLIRAGNAVTLAPQSLVPVDLVAVAVAGLNVERSIGLQWHERLDQALLSLVLDAVQDATRPSPDSVH